MYHSLNTRKYIEILSLMKSVEIVSIYFSMEPRFHLLINLFMGKEEAHLYVSKAKNLLLV